MPAPTPPASIPSGPVPRRPAPPQPITPIGVLSTRLRRLGDQVVSGGPIDEAFRNELAALTDLASGFEAYVDRCTSQPSPMLAELAVRTAGEDWTDRHQRGTTTLPLRQEMMSGHAEGQFLQMLIRITGSKRVLEIGTFTGYSALAMAEALPADGRLIALEVDPYAAEFAQAAFDASPHGDKIDLRLGPARQSLAELRRQGAWFDFVFIDADKTGYRGYLDQLLGDDTDDAAAATLLADNALICVDNTMLQGEPYLLHLAGDNGHAVARFNDSVAADDRLHQVMVPIRDGVTLIQRVADFKGPTTSRTNPH